MPSLHKLPLFSLFFLCCVSSAWAEGITWSKFDDQVFARAEAQKRLVILDLEAVWCHWCHVMEKETYSNPKVQELINTRFVAVRADQDSRPDLATRYQDYGWPATIILSAKGEDLAKKAGFIEPEEMIRWLEDLSTHPTPRHDDEHVTVAASGASALPGEIKAGLIENHRTKTDRVLGGLKTSHKYIDIDTFEYSLRQAMTHDEAERSFVITTLNNNRKLLDPVWGGLYQYSTHRDWDHPHYEKIMSSQARGMRAYSYGFAAFKDPEYLNAAEAIYRYVKNFLTSPEGAFYTSQDADAVRGVHSEGYFAKNDEQRRKEGIPVVDQHRYSRENGWMIEALCALYASAGDKSALDDAKKAALWIEAHRKLPGGGFRHDEVDPSGPYLGDTLAMARAFLALYQATGERSWLTKAQEAAAFISTNFVESGKAGYLSSDPKKAGAVKPIRLNDENIQVGRFYAALHHYTGNAKYKELAASALQHLSDKKVAFNYVTEAGILLLDQEINEAPLHITVVGNKDDQSAEALFRSGLAFPATHKRIEWWDKREGAMPNPDVEYPQLPKAAAFICTNRRCSLPIFQPEGIAKTIDLFEKNKG